MSSPTYSRPKRVLNLKKDRPDLRDLRLAAPAPNQLQVLPTIFSLQSLMPPVYDQGQTGSCTGNAIAGNVHYQEIREGKPSPLVPSRLFIYYNERLLEGTTGEDAGAEIRDGIKALANFGFCNEDAWPFDPSQLTVRPSARAYMIANREKISRYMRVEQNLNAMKHCLAAGHPIVVGLTLYSSFQSDQMAESGVGRMPAAGEQIDGGHAVLIVGYNDAAQTFLFRNSWGANWGMGGYFTMPYAYVLNADLASDFWTILFV